MAIEFKCQGCEKTLRVPDEFGGRKAKCPNCQAILQVPAETETVTPLDVQPPIESSPDLFAGMDTRDSPQSGYKQPSAPNPARSRERFATGNPYSAPQPQTPQPQLNPRRRGTGAPHRGGLILGLGIAGFVCCVIPGFVAFFMGISDLQAMKEGRMDGEGHGLTLGGTIMGGVSVGLTALGILLGIIVAVLGG